MVKIISTAALGSDFDCYDSEVDGIVYDTIEPARPLRRGNSTDQSDPSLPEVAAPIAERCDDGANVMEGSFEW